MGLGKTAQAIAMLDHIWRRESIRGPFLIVAPLSTLAHWQREIEEWTDLSVLNYYDPARPSALVGAQWLASSYRSGCGGRCQSHLAIMGGKQP